MKSGYMAPECTLGRKLQLSIKSDVYSYGVVLLEMVIGSRVSDQVTADGVVNGCVNLGWGVFAPGRALEELTGILKVTRRSIYNYVKAGQLKAVKIGREWRVTQKALDDFLEHGTADGYYKTVSSKAKKPSSR